MKSSLKLFALCICIAVASCKSADITKTHVINLPEALENIGLINLSEVANSIKYIPLETREDALVGEYPRIAYDGNHIVVAEPFRGSIKVFDSEGKFVRSIDRVGRGPEEYQPQVIGFSLLNGNIVVVTIREVIEYDISGNFIRRVTIPNVEGYNVVSPIMINENRYAAALVDFTSENKEYCAVVYDSLLVIEQLIATPSDLEIKIASPSGSGGAVVFMPTKLIRNDEKFFLFQPESKEILSVENPNAIDTAYVIEYGVYRMPDGHASNISVDNRYLSLMSFIETRDFLFMNVNTMATITTTGSRFLTFLYDKQAQKTSVLYDRIEDKRGFKDDIGKGLEFLPKSVFGRNTILSDITALSLIEFAENNTVSEELAKIVSTIDENSNPIIAIVELK